MKRWAFGVWVMVARKAINAWQKTSTFRLVLLAAVFTATPAWGQQVTPSAVKIDSTATVGGRFGSDYGEAYLSIFAPISQKEDGLIFINPRFALKDEGASEGNLGIGIRQMLSNQNAIIGANLYVDRSRSRYDIDHDQWGLGLEFLTDSWDFRANYYDPGSSTPIAATTDINTMSSVTDVMRSVATVETVTEAIVGSRTNVVNTDFYRGNNILAQTVSTRTDRVRTTTDIRQTTTTTFTTTDTFTDLLFEKREGGLEGYDLELGYKFPLPETMPEVRLFGGYYDFEGPFDSEIKGAKGRVEVRAGEYFTFDAEVFEDEELHGSDYFVGARVNLPFSFSNLVNGKNPFLARKHDMITFRNRSLSARIGEEVIRDVNVHVAESPFVENRAKRRVTKEQSVAVEVDVVETSEFSDRNVVSVVENSRFYTNDGDRITVTHLDSNASGADIGTFEDPNQTLTSANATQAADANDIILLHSDSSFDGETVNVTDDQSLIGQGGGIQTTVETDQGSLVLPEAGNPNGATATINNGGVQINSNNVLVNNVVVNQGSVTTAGASTHTDLTITNVHVTGSGGNGFELGTNGGTLGGTITLENITVENSAGSGIVLENLQAGGTVVANSTTASGNAANGIDILNSAGTFNFTDTNTDTSGNAGIFVENNTGAVNFENTTVTDPGAAGIQLSNNNGNVSFGTTNVDLGNTAGTAGIDFINNNGTTSFGTVTITDVGAGDNQVGVDFNGATLTNQIDFDSVAISGPASSTTSIGVDLTGVQGNQIVNMGSNVDPATGPSSSIVNTHRGVLIDPTASVHFTFGDGESPSDIGSIIDVNNADDFSYTVDAGGGTLGSASFNFDDVVVGAGDEANFPAAPSNLVFVSTGGGVVTAGTNGLNIDVMTIDPFQAESQANVGQTFVFVGDAGGIIDVALGMTDGFTLDMGQSIDGFNNGNSFIFGTLQPVNISGNLGVTGGNITANSATVINSDRFSNSIVNVAGGNSTVANNIFDGTLDVAWIGNPANAPVSVINVAGAANDVSIIGADITNVSDMPVTHVGINLDNNAGNVTLMDVALTGSNAGTGLQVDATTASTGQVTGDANTSFGATTGTVVSIGAGARDINLGATTTTSSLNTSTAIMIDGQSGGTISFGDVTLNGGTGTSAIESLNQSGGTLSFGMVDVGGMTGFNGVGNAINIAGIGGAVNFTEIDIVATTGNGLGVGGQMLSITNTTNTITANAGAGLFLGNTNVGGGITFDQINSTGGVFGVFLGNVTGNVAINGGSINDSTVDGFAINGGTGDVTYAGDITQSLANSAVSVAGGHTGTVTFMTGTINATNGDGLQFNNADGNYNFNGAITLNGGDAGIDIVGGSAGTFTFADTTINNSTGIAVNMDSSPGTATFRDLIITQSVGHGVQANNSGNLVIGVGGLNPSEIDNVTGDGINITNTNTRIEVVQIGEDGNIGDGGIEITNNDGVDRTAVIDFNNIFELSGTPIPGVGIQINAQSGTLTADLINNFIATDDHAIATQDGGVANSLILSLTGNSTLTTNNAGVPTMEIVGSGLDSTIVTAWDAPNQVIGDVGVFGSAGGGIVFNQVTFDADVNTAGNQQVMFTGTLDIGAVPPSTIARVTGDGLSFLNTSGSLRINELNVANFNGTGLEVDTKGLGTTFTLDIAGGDIDTLGGQALYLDPLFGDITFNTVTSTNSAVLGGTAATASSDGSGVTIDALTASGGVGTNALTIGELNISGPATDGLNINNTVGNVTIGTAGGAAGSGGTIESNGGNAVNITGGNAAVTLNNVNVNATGGTAVNINGGSMGNVSLVNTDVAQLGTGRAINVDGAAAGNILFDAAGSVTATVANNTGININNTDANVTVANATLSNTVGDAVSITGGTGQMNFDNLDVANSGGDGIQSVDLAGTLMVQNGSSFTGITGDGINVDNTVATATVVQVLGTAGVNTFDTIGDDAISVTNSTGNITISDVNSTGVTGDMLQQTNHTGTTTVTNGLTLANLALGGTSIAQFINQTGTVNVNDALISNLIINGGNANFNFNAGTMLVNTNNTATIDITNHTGGTVDFDGTINATNGSGLQFNNADGTYDFSGSVTLNGGDAGIDIIGGSAGTFTFSNTTLINNAAGGMGVNMDGSAGASLTFSGGLDIATTDAIGFNATGGGTIAVSATAGTEQIITNGTGGAINVDGVAVAGGGVSFDQITTAATTTDQGIDINDATGGTFTFANVSLDGTAATTGLDISGNARSSNVVVSGGSIDNGVRIQDGGTGTVTIDAAITDNAGYAVQVANRGAGSGLVDINGNVTNNTGAVSIQTNTGGDVRFDGMVTGTGTINAGAIDIDGNTGGTTNFNGLVDIDVTGAGTGVMIGSTNTAGAAINFNGGLEINSTTSTAFEALGGTLGIADAGSRFIATTSGTALNLDGVTLAAGGANFGSIGNSLAATTVVIDLNDISGGALTADDAAILTGNGIDISGTIGSAITFDNVDIALNAMNQTAVDLSGATINANLSFGDFDVTSTSAVGTTGVDLAGTTGTGTIQLGDTNTNGGPSVSVGAVGMELASGVNVDATTDLNFILGDGDGTVGPGSDGVASTMTVTNAVTGVLPANGTYNFADIDFTTSNVNNLLGATVYFVDQATNGDGSSQTTAGTIVGAEASGADAIILLDGTAGAGGNIIDMSAGIHAGSGGGVNTLDLADGQVLLGLTAGQMIDLSNFGLGVAPANFITNLGGTPIITGLAGLEAAPTLTTNNGDTITLGGNNTVQGITVTNTGTGSGISGVFAANTEIAINSTTATGGSAGAGILIDGSGGGTTTITSFNGNTVIDAGARGINFNGVTFDADTSTAGIQQVMGGNTTVGTIGNRVAGDGIRMNNVLGDIAFGTLNVFNDTGTGLFVRDAGTKGGGSFAISTTGGTIDTTNGTAMDIDPVMADFTFGSVSSTNANGQGSSNNQAGGVFFDAVDAQGGAASNAVSIGTLSVTGSNGDGINIDNSSGTFTFGATTIDNTASNGGGVDLDTGNNDNLTVNFTSDLNIDISDGNDASAGFDADGSATGSTLTLGVAATAGDQSILVTDSAPGIVHLNDVVIGAGGVHFDSLQATGTAAAAELTDRAIDIVDTTGGAFSADTVAVTDGPNSLFTFDGGAINIEDSAASFTFGSINLQNQENNQYEGIRLLGANGDVNITTVAIGNAPGSRMGQGLLVDGNTNEVNVMGGTITVGSGSGALFVQNQAAGGSTTFTNLALTSADADTVRLTDNMGSITFTGGTITNNGTGVAFQASDSVDINGGSATINIGSNIVNADTGANVQAVEITETSGNITLSGNITNTNGGELIAIGFDSINAGLGGPTAGTIAFTGTTLSDTSGDGIIINDVSAGAAVTFSAGTSVNIQTPVTTGLDITNNAGTVTFNGSVTVNSGTNTAVNINNNTGGNINFAGGGLDIDTTTAAGFTATGGGTVTVQGTGNTVNTTTGTAVNIVNTTIGGSGVTFQSVSSSGSTNGIVLNTTGAGGFTIAGDGTTTRNNSGGTIQNTTGSAILLTNASNIDINHLNITDAGIHAIDGTGVNNFTFRHSTVSGIGPAAVDDHNAFNFVTGAQSVIGTVLVDNVAFTNFEDTAIDIANTSGAVNVTVSNSVFSNNHATFGNEAIAVDSQNTALFNLNVTGNTFTNVQGDAVAARVGGSGGTHDINITGNTSTHALNVGGGDFLIQMTNGADVTFDINNNTVDHASQLLSGDPIQIVGNGDAEGRIVGNTLSGYGGDAIRLDMGGSTAASAGNITWTILIQNNDIGVLGNPGASRSGTADEAIEIFSRDHSGTLNVTIDNNRIHNPLSRAVNLFSDEDSPSGTGPTNNIAIINNTFTGVPGDSIRIRSTDADPITTCAHIVGNTGTGGIFLDEDTTPTGTSIEITQASLAALNAANTGLTANQNDGAIGFNGGCNMVSLPTNP
ncbi:MAG: inverse autotransporter beta domain-containing protein [Pseudomonadota bacterium]